MIYRLIATAASAVALISAANAADIYRAPEGVSYKDAPYVATSWAGFYAGVNGGYAFSSDGNSYTIPKPAFGTIPGAKPEGGFGGGQIGYNWQGMWHPHLVFGIEADIQGADISDNYRYTSTSVARGASDNVDYFGTVRARIGYAFDRTLVYATGGFAYGNLNVKVRDGVGVVGYKVDDVETGYAVGGGVEYKINPAWSLKAEYQYINFIDVSLNGVVPSTVGTHSSNYDFDFHTVRAGLNYHFGSTYEPLK
jgi:outer membrane immunogenic protein